MTPSDYGALLALSAPPITDQQAEAAARIFASIQPKDAAA